MFLNASKKLIFSLLLILISAVVFGAPRFVVVAPGEVYTGLGAKNSAGLLPQVAGVPFNVTVYSAEDSTWAYLSTGAQVGMTVPNGSFNPSSFTLDQAAGAVSDSMRYPVQVTITEAYAGGNQLIVASNTGAQGVSPGSVTVTVQKMTNFGFTTIASPRTAGGVFAVTITARTAANATVTNFQGTANLTAAYSGGGSVNLGSVQFTNGVYTGLLTLYDATEGAQTVILNCTSTVPSVSSTSNSFAVNSGTLNRMLIIGPGQTYEPGMQSGNGRVGGSTATSQQTAGTPFSVTVYACDAYFNTITSASGTATMSSSDPNVTFSPSTSQSLSSGKAVFMVTMARVGSGTQEISVAYSGATSNSDTVPVTNGSLDHFSITTNIPTITAGQTYTIAAVALDAYDNTVTSFTQVVGLSAYSGGVAIASTNWQAQSNGAFINGIMSGSSRARFRIYQRTVSATVGFVYSGSEGYSNVFTVNPGNPSKLLVIAPGETHDPGNNSNGGKSGAPNSVAAGSTVSIDIYETDLYGNRITTIPDQQVVVSAPTDSQASINGLPVPVTVTMSAGYVNVNAVLRTSGNQQVRAENITTALTVGTTTIPVTTNTVSYFEIANISSPQTVGSSCNPVIRARDEYGNIAAGWSGTVWVSSPDTDFALPDETTISLSGTGVSASDHRWQVVFAAGNNGVRSDLTGYFYRSVTWSVRLFVSDVETDSVDNRTGHTGLSSGVTVNSGTANRMFVLAPGMEHRPGTSDGVNGSPIGQSAGYPFPVTVSVVDSWYNIIPGRTDSVGIDTVDNPNSLINGAEPTPTPVPVSLTNGSRILNVQYKQQSTSFWVRAHNNSVGGILDYTTPNITVFNVRKFLITAPGGSAITQQTAGLPFQISITAYQDDYASMPASGFTGTIKLKASNDYSDSEYCIEPTTSDAFVNGVCVMNVTMYRASTTRTGVGVQIEGLYGATKDTSNQFSLWWKPVTDVLVLIDGMTHKPGLNHVGIPAYKGYIGSPKTVEAGQAFQLEVIYVDEYYNRVLDVNTYCRMTSTDTQATIASVPLSTNNVYVTITAGGYPGSPYANAVLRRVGETGLHTFTAEPGGTLPNNTCPSISIRHTDYDHFAVLAPAGPIVAGAPFNVTLQALDEFQNLCDSLNGGIPFGNTVTLNPVNMPSNTIYPTQYPLTNGSAIASMRIFRAPETTARIQAVYESVSGVSSNIVTASAEFERLLVMANGMMREQGVYTGSTPGTFPMYSGAPNFGSGNPVNDAAHTPLGYQFTVYSCDAYGNVTMTPDVTGYTVTVSTTDSYAVPVTQSAISATTGELLRNVIFHTAMSGVNVTAQINRPGISSFTTPNFTTTAGTPYGMQMIVPGLYAVPGSGYYDTAGFDWFNGVGGSEQTQLSGNPFPVVVQACDIYGNFTNSPINNVRVRTTSTNPSSYPNTTTFFDGPLGSYEPGRVTLTATLVPIGTSQSIELRVQDLESPQTLERVWKLYPNIYVTNSGELDYELIVNGVTYGDSSNSITAVSYPDTFSMTLNVIDAVSGQPVFGASNLFMLEAVRWNAPTTLASGQLNIQSGSVSNGKFITSNQWYNAAERIRIRVTDPNANLDPKWSCIIDFAANSLNANMTLISSPANIRSGTVSTIIANVSDPNGYPVIGQPVYFEFLSGSSTSTGEFPEGVTGVAVTDSSGNAIIPFTGGYINGNCIVQATYYAADTIVRTTTVRVSLTDPIIGQVSNYPNPFRAGNESTYISYLLAEATDVNIRIFTLFGDLVWSREIPRNEPGAVAGEVNIVEWDGLNMKGKTVGNGGYLCVVEAVVNGQNRKMMRKIAVQK